VKTSEKLRDTKSWLDEHRRFVDEDVIQGYDANLDGLSVYIKQCAEMEVLLKSAHEFMTGEWQPDDLDRHRFVERLAAVLREDSADDTAECECGRLKEECATADDDNAEHGDRKL
jgi:hypothetical protein